MVCCCRKPQEIDDPINGYPANAAKSPSPKKMDRRGHDDDGDDDSDKEAVRWFRNRSLEKKHSFEEFVPQVEAPTVPPPVPKVGTLSPRSDKKANAPVDLDSFMDMHTPSQDSEENSDDLADMRLQGHVGIHEEEESEPKPASPKPASPTSIHVPDEKDLEAQEKYAEACRLLHKTLIEKQNVLTLSEHAFLDELVTSLDSAENNLEQLSDVESAVHVLETDPLFQDQPFTTHLSDDPDSAAQNGQAPMDSKRTLSLSSDKNESSSDDPFASSFSFPSTDDTEPSVKEKTSSLSSKGGSQDPLSFTSSMSDRGIQGTRADAGDEQWWDFGGVQEAPQLIDDDHLETPSKRPKKEDRDEQQVLVRFDGWTNIGGQTGPFNILGTSIDDQSAKPHVISPLLMEALRGFLPYSVSEENFWLKFSLLRDGASLSTLLHSVRASARTIIGIETIDGDVFGSFTGTPWRVQSGWFGSGEAFLWRLKHSRFSTLKAIKEKPNMDSEMEVYPFTGTDNYCQFCTRNTLGVGGGDWIGQDSPHRGEPSGIGLMIDGDLAGGETNSSATFANPRLCRRSRKTNEFDISNIEVWTLTPCTSVAEAEKLELRKLFVEEHRSTIL